MKKLASLTLSILLLLSSTACGASNQNENCQCNCQCESCECNTSLDVSVTDTISPSFEEDSSDNNTTSPASASTEDTTTITTSKEKDFTTTKEDDNSSKSSTNNQVKLSDDFKELIYTEAKERYLSGEWDGSPTKLYGQDIVISTTSNSLLINGGIVSNHYWENWDIPDNWNSLNIQAVSRYTPDTGVFAIEDNTLVRYVRGKNIINKGGAFTWKGLDVTRPEEFGCTIDDYVIYLPSSTGENDYRYLIGYSPYLYYYERADVLLLVTTDPITNRQYLYTFPDYNVSEIKFLGRIIDFCVFGASYSMDTFYYLDTNMVTWRWSETGPVIDLDSTLFSDYFPKN